MVNMQMAIVQNLVIKKDELLSIQETWVNGESICININKIKNTTVVNGALMYLITYKALTKFQNLNKGTNRIFIPSTNETFYIEDILIDNIWTTLDLKRVEG